MYVRVCGDTVDSDNRPDSLSFTSAAAESAAAAAPTEAEAAAVAVIATFLWKMQQFSASGFCRMAPGQAAVSLPTYDL